jgi:hypothetical protein
VLVENNGNPPTRPQRRSICVYEQCKSGSITPAFSTVAPDEGELILSHPGSGQCRIEKNILSATGIEPHPFNP